MKFKVGDIVKVTDCNKVYHYYNSWAKLHNLPKWDTDLSIVAGLTGKVVAVGLHQNMRSRTLLGVQIDDGRSFIIRDVGVEMLESVSEYPKEMYVWDNDKTFEERQTVLAHVPELDTPYLVRSTLQNDRFMGFKHARDVPQQTELSMQEIADKFNIDVKQLKIKK